LENYAIDILVNAAGFGTRGLFVEKPIEPELNMMDVHMKAPVRLVHRILPNMIERQRGVIINIASVGAFVPQAKNLIYGPTKAFMNAFSTNLQTEVGRHGIKVQSLCPGYTRTEFHEVGYFEGFDKRKIPSSMWQSKENVVKYALKKLKSHKIYAIPGIKYRLIVFLMQRGWFRRLVSVFR
jgi:short-subunit dehydrogenase